MITIIRDRSIKKVFHKGLLSQDLTEQHNDIEQILIDQDRELELARLGAVHQEFRQINGVFYEPVTSDNLDRLLHEYPAFIDGRQWIPINKEFRRIT